MSFPSLAYAFIVLAVVWLISHALLMPQPIPGIPYNFLARCMPSGDLLPLGIYNWRTGEVFSWLSLQCAKHRSPLVQLFLPSFSTTLPTLVLADLDEIEDIVTKRVCEIDRADLMHTWFGLIAPRATIGSKSSDKAFKEQRRLWNVVLSPTFLQEVAAPCFLEAGNELADLWERKASLATPGHAFNAQEDVKVATLDGMWEMCVGTKFGVLSAKIERLQRPVAVKRCTANTIEFARSDMPRFYDVFGTLLMCLDWVMQGISPRVYTWVFTYSGVLGRASKEKARILGCYIDTARQRVETGASGRTCALDQVLYKDIRLKGDTKEHSEAITNASLRDELLELLITGHETTASSICWALKYLTDNPATQDRLRESLHSAFPRSKCSPVPLTSELLSASLPYLDAVIAETLRLSNTGPVSFRQTLVNCEILGHRIPAHTPIILVTAGPSYASPDTERITPTKSSQSLSEKNSLEAYSSPPRPPQLYCRDTFAPERWLQSGKFDPNAVHMLPFSAGSRGCFGKRIAMLELRILIAVLILRFGFPLLGSTLSGYQVRDGLTSRPAYCYVSPRKASGSSSITR